MRSSRAAVDLIVANEVTSKAYYEKHYVRPEWPGGASGLTVGIGYDLGYNTEDTILHDWAGKLTPDVIAKMQRFAGVTGQAAKAQLANAHSIVVPWDAAMAVFMDVSLPKFENLTLKACPGSEKLPAGCFGVLASLTYNRGASYTKDGDRYREMRNIRALVMRGEWDKVEHEIRSMKRLWPGVAGLLRRRDEEADLWRRSLAAAPATLPAPAPRADTGDDKDDHEPVTPEGNDDLNVQPPRGKYSLEVDLIQRQLIEMKYFEVGEPDGLIGGKFVAGVAAFMTDRGKDPARGRITPELKNELAKAKSEGWSRPISTTRANATAKDIADKVPSVNATWYQKLLAWILGLPAAAGAGVKALFGDDPSSYVGKIKDTLSAVPTEFWLLGVAALAVGIFLAAKQAQDVTVRAYNEGKIN